MNRMWRRTYEFPWLPIELIYSECQLTCAFVSAPWEWIIHYAKPVQTIFPSPEPISLTISFHLIPVTAPQGTLQRKLWRRFFTLRKLPSDGGPLDRLCGLVVRVPGYRSRYPDFDSRRYQIFWEVVGLERGPLSLVSTIEELLGRNSSRSSLETREYGRGDPLRWPRDTLYPQKLALTSPKSGGRSVSIDRLRTKATEFFLWTLV
jgi:hypothetical protein